MDESQIKECCSSSPLPHDLTAKLVYSYLIHNCYSSTAKSFSTALRIQPICSDVKMTDVHDERIGTGGLVGSSPELLYLESLQKPLASLDKRKALVGLILSGSVALAKQMFSAEFTNIYNSNSKQVQDVLFILSCQEFIELVAINSESALEYVKKELEKFLDISYRNELEELVTLLAYANPHSSRVGHYLTMNRREMVAKKLNSLILGKVNA